MVNRYFIYKQAILKEAEQLVQRKPVENNVTRIRYQAKRNEA